MPYPPTPRIGGYSLKSGDLLLRKSDESLLRKFDDAKLMVTFLSPKLLSQNEIKIFLPQKHQSAKKHKKFNINQLWLGEFSCLYALVAENHVMRQPLFRKVVFSFCENQMNHCCENLTMQNCQLQVFLIFAF